MSLLKRTIRTLIQLVSFGIIAISVVLFAESSNYIQVQENKILYPYGEKSNNPHYSALIRLSNDGGFFCSAVVIDKHYALTAGHCVVGLFGKLQKEKIRIETTDSSFTGIEAQAVAVDLYRDVALLIGDFNNFENIKADFSGENTEIIARKLVVACGFPGGGNKFCSIMQILGNSGFQLQSIGGILQKGMSGGPVLDIASGTVIGVNSAAGTNYNLFGPIMGLDAIFGIRDF